jgi:hypothetical protein
LGSKADRQELQDHGNDIFTVQNGKLARAHHVENWMTAVQQIKG